MRDTDAITDRHSVFRPSAGASTGAGRRTQPQRVLDDICGLQSRTIHRVVVDIFRGQLRDVIW